MAEDAKPREPGTSQAPSGNDLAFASEAPEPDAGIEEAYQKALAAVEEYEWALSGPGQEAPAGDLLGASAPAIRPESAAEGTNPGQGATPPEQAAPEAAPSAVPPMSPPLAAAGAGIASSTQASAPWSAGDEPAPEVDPTQVIEAALFVGGISLGPKQLCSLLRGAYDADALAAMIDAMNASYAMQERPYEIRLLEGGYELALRPEFEKLRQRVHGAGPREVKLSPDVLEVLALVAYRQPITQAEIEAAGKPNAGNLLRQLLRRDLIRLERVETGQRARVVRYHTTERFLSVFGLARLEDLPTPELK